MFPAQWSEEHRQYFVTCISLQQASGAFANIISGQIMFLCVDVPRAKWCKTLREAVAFYENKNDN